MKPRINKTSFGSITVGGETFDHDIIIRLHGDVKKRKKKLSKEYYGSSHTISLEEAEYVYEEGAQKLLIGSGQYGMVRLSDEAANFFSRKSCEVDLIPTGSAIKEWNEEKGSVIGLFHITC
ncbi:MAG: hypothetical protein JSW63_13030 [Ignavibacterium sp.]|nr:MAG: hypothetical protein JSW63_13030 [Ignavibacterium sp.]